MGNCNKPIVFFHHTCKESTHQSEIIKGLCLRQECKKTCPVCNLCTLDLHKDCSSFIKNFKNISQLLQPFQQIQSQVIKNSTKDTQELIYEIEQILNPINGYFNNPDLNNLIQLGIFLRQAVNFEKQLNILLEKCELINFKESIKQIVQSTKDLIILGITHNIFSGIQLKSENKYQEAIYCFEQAILIDQNNFEAWNNKGFALIEQNKYLEAIYCFEYVILIDQNNVQAWNNKGIALQAQNKNSEALYCYDQAILIDQKNVKAQSQKGIILKKTIQNWDKIYIPCQFQSHVNQKINKICFNKDCHSKRLCCLTCINEIHSAHQNKLIQIDFLQAFLEQVCSEHERNPQSYTYGQCQVVQNLKDLQNQIGCLRKIIEEEIYKLKQLNFQQYLQEQSNDYLRQVIQYWHEQIQCLLHFFTVDNKLLTKKNQWEGLLIELEQKIVQIIKQVKDGLKQIIKEFQKPPKNYQLKFKSDPDILYGHLSDVYGVVISSDGSIIASGSNDNSVKLWDATTKQLMQTFNYSGEVYGVAISSKSQFLAYGGGGDFSLQLHNLKQNKSYGTLKGHTLIISSIAFSSDSQFLFSGGNDKKLIIWSLIQKRQIHQLKTMTFIQTIVTTPNNKIISCECIESIDIWSFKTQKKLIHQKFSQGNGLCSSKDSSTFISSGSGWCGLIEIWRLNDVDNNQFSQQTLTKIRKIMAADNAISQVILTSDENYIISICNKEGKIMIHEIESQNLIQELKYEKGSSRSGYISISDDMNVLVSGGDDETVKIWTRQ